MKHGAEVVCAALLAATGIAWAVFAWAAGEAPRVLLTRQTCEVTCGSWQEYVPHFSGPQFAALAVAITLSVALVTSFFVLADKRGW